MFSYVLALFINSSVVAVMLSIMAKLSAILKSECGGCGGVSALPGIRVKGDIDSAIKEHHLFFSHSSDFDDFSMLASNSNDFKVTLMESLLIDRDHSPLNKNSIFGTV